MSSWDRGVFQEIERRLRKFVRHKCVVLLDPDEIVDIPVQQELRSSGWVVSLLTGDPLRIREDYESACRVEESTRRRQILLSAERNTSLPYDIAHDNPVIIIKLEDLFPQFDVKVLRALPRSWYELMYAKATERKLKTALSAVDTLKFALECCLNVSLPSPPTLGSYVQFLAHLVVSGQKLPEELRHEIARLFSRVVPESAPLDAENGKRLFQILWSKYGNSVASGSSGVSEKEAEYLGQLGREVLSHLDSSPEMQGAFTLLRTHGLIPLLSVGGVPNPSWLSEGIHYSVPKQGDLLKRLTDIEQSLPTETSKWNHWATFAWQWAGLRLRYYREERPSKEVESAFRRTHKVVEQRFLDWMQRNFSDLLSRPYLPQPTVVHQLLHYLANAFDIPRNNRLAVLLVDGMSLDDWLVVRDSLTLTTWKVREISLLAFVPTITQVSRQSLLSGKLPVEFADSLTGTHNEQKLWHQFWGEHGCASRAIAYQRNIAFDEKWKFERERVAALIFNALDDLIHRSEDATGLYAQWSAFLKRTGAVQSIIDKLREYFDVIVITSDHGHIEGVGAGDIPLGKVADTRAMRVRMFRKLMADTAIEHPAASKWPAIGLPSTYTVLVAKGMSLFTRKGERAVAHGGVSIEEVIIPAIILTQKDRYERP